MDNQRLFLLFALVLVVVLIWQAWETQVSRHAAAPPAPTAAAPPIGEIPAAPTTGEPAPGAPPEAPAAAAAPKTPTAPFERGTRVHVTTDVFEAVIDTAGGDLRELLLREYPVAADKPKEPLALLTEHGAELFVAQSGLIGHGAQYPNHKTRFIAPAERYILKNGQDTLRVPLTWRAPDGIEYTKAYIFYRNSYRIGVEFTVVNRSKREWQGYFYGQLVRAHVARRGWLAVPTYTGGATYTPDDKYQKIPFDKMADKPLKRDATGGWVAILQHYFVGAWISDPKQQHQFYTDVLDTTRYVIGLKNRSPTVVLPGQSGSLTETLYIGPKEHKRLRKLDQGMDLTVDYGWLTVIASPLFWLLDHIHRFVGNWGWAIIILTLLIKLVFYPLSATSYKSMAQMKKVQPKLQSIKERYGDDRQKMNQAMMELYKTEKINPLGGCLPIIIQIPVFIALYWVLLETVEMRQAPFVLWIKDLSTPDPFYVLPVIMGSTMFLQSKLNPTPMDPMQKRIFTIMPVAFTVFFLFFPAGLVLYWVVNNVLSIAQQWYINRSIGAKYR